MDNLTPGEQRTFMLGLLCATDGLTNIKVDYDKLAEKAGLKNAASASVLFNKSRRKILLALTENAGGIATSGTPKKAATADKVTKTRKSAKGKGATNEAHIEEFNDNADDDVNINPGKTTKAKRGKGKAGVKVKTDPNGMVPIKQEAFIKQELFNDEFAKGIIDGTSYPCAGITLNNLWAAGAFSTGNGTTASGSPLDPELDNESV
ncbi:hypothetical protein McanMca71_003427 [Microsporum canis]|uniref:Histone h1.3 n=1 Tax=Arthroderma otae (strain ATCC MYA-4605 / CBS 113480) TaxID=554155 RepID=C5FSP6_ARTOC|nr:uncharacterized protein MCYG_05718 [Microsporum canis CBS 113480]EEQ32899.1 predicted protein [Microsporum canis CBS 113480]